VEDVGSAHDILGMKVVCVLHFPSMKVISGPGNKFSVWKSALGLEVSSRPVTPKLAWKSHSCCRFLGMEVAFVLGDSSHGTLEW
jgi:hypothetical protein